MAGDERSGVCIMRMSAGLDEGPVCMSASLDITGQTTAGDLHDVVSRIGVARPQLVDPGREVLGAVDVIPGGDAHEPARAIGPYGVRARVTGPHADAVEARRSVDVADHGTICSQRETTMSVAPRAFSSGSSRGSSPRTRHSSACSTGTT